MIVCLSNQVFFLSFNDVLMEQMLGAVLGHVWEFAMRFREVFRGHIWDMFEASVGCL